MTLAWLVFKSLRQHAFSTAVTVGSIALAGGLWMSVWSVKDQCRRAFTQVTGGFDAVLGARSSKLQLVLNGVFHLEASPANITRDDFLEIRDHPGVALAMPLAMGDNYRGYRVVGTLVDAMRVVEYASGRRYQLAAGGRWFDPSYKEAVVGSYAAAKLGLRVGDHFHPYHGLSFEADKEHEEEEYLVVGVLQPSNTPADRVLWIPLEGVQRMTGHAAEQATAVSAVLVKLRSPMTGKALEEKYNRQGQKLTFAWPIGATMAELMDKFVWLERVLALVAYGVAIVAAGSVLASIYNSMNERRHQIAVLRALGAHRRTVFWSVVLEAVAIATVGMSLAFGILAGILMLAGTIIRRQTGVEIDVLFWHGVMWWAPLGMIALGALAGMIPAWKAYRTAVATYLAR